MPRATKAKDAKAAPAPLIIEVEGYEGQDGSISVLNERALRSKAFGVPEKIYCIGAMGADGVIRFDDWGYATAEQARYALHGRLKALGQA